MQNLALRHDHLQDYVKDYSKKVTDLLQIMSVSITKKFNAVESRQLAFMIIDEVLESLDLLVAALTPIHQGFILSSLGINHPNEIFFLKWDCQSSTTNKGRSKF